MGRVGDSMTFFFIPACHFCLPSLSSLSTNPNGVSICFPCTLCGGLGLAVKFLPELIDKIHDLSRQNICIKRKTNQKSLRTASCAMLPVSITP